MSDPKFEPGDKFVERSHPDAKVFEVLTEGHGDERGIFYLTRNHADMVGFHTESFMRPIPRVVFTEAQIELFKTLWDKYAYLTDGIDFTPKLVLTRIGLGEVIATLRRDHREEAKEKRND